MNKRIKVALADDHKLFRKGLIAILKTNPDIETVFEAENGKEAIAHIVEGRPDVLLLDLNMPVMSGWDVLAELKKRKINIPAIIITMYEEETVIVNAIKGGAVGYLSKNAEPEEIFMALESVLESGFYFNEATNKAMLRKMLQNSNINTPYAPAPIELDQRELEVLRLIADEMSTQEIAAKMYLSLRTVEVSRQRLFEKFGAKNVVGLVIMASRRGFIPL
jgi:DNA-binding NarL/FixJ family response regulator